MTDILDMTLPWLFGEPKSRGQIRVEPADFIGQITAAMGIITSNATSQPRAVQLLGKRSPAVRTAGA